MKDNELIYIGEIHTPYQTVEECPNNVDVKESVCTIEVYEPYVNGLTSLKKGEKILILYWFTGVKRETCVSASRSSGKVRGTFGLRSPHRPNPIAVAERTIESIDGNILTVLNMDCVNGTKLLDIKPVLQ